MVAAVHLADRAPGGLDVKAAVGGFATTSCVYQQLPVSLIVLEPSRILEFLSMLYNQKLVGN